jgi:hypothetical protein
MRTIITRKSAASLAATAVLAVSLAACSQDTGTEAQAGNQQQSSQQEQAAPKAVASIPALTGEDTAVALDKGFTDALTQLELTPGVVGSAKLTDGSLVFPITGGNVTVFEPGAVDPYVIGQVQHEGSGFSLTAGDTTVEITNLNVDPGVSKVYGDVAVNGEVAASSVPVFNLDGRTLNPLETQGNQAILEGTKVQISEVAAPLLNDVFKTDAVKPGLLVGTATITVDVK